jgi:hypothetical protein
MADRTSAYTCSFVRWFELAKIAFWGEAEGLQLNRAHSEVAMKCLRIYATPDGESHFGDADIPKTMMPLFPNEASFQLSGDYPASRIRFVHIPAGVREAGWHTPPGRVLAVWLDGIVEFETSDGEVRRVSGGSPVLVEDTHGKGHISRHPIEGQSLILVTLPHGLDSPEFN